MAPPRIDRSASPTKLSLKQLDEAVSAIRREIMVKTTKEHDWRGMRTVTRYMLSDAGFERFVNLQFEIDRALLHETENRNLE